MDLAWTGLQTQDLTRDPGQKICTGSGTDSGLYTMECGDGTYLDVGSDDRSSKKSPISFPYPYLILLSFPLEDKEWWSKTLVH